MTSQTALPYEEPGIRAILIQSGLILALKFSNYVLDKLVYCGLIGQIFMGVAWGMPGGAKWLTLEAQEMMQQLGYLGLLLLVYEGEISFILFAPVTVFKYNLGGPRYQGVSVSGRCVA